MADKRKLYPISLPQNPTPVGSEPQPYIRKLEELTENILIAYKDVLPSNYVSLTTGPNYLENFRIFAENLAKIQLAMQEIAEDVDYNFTRSEYLWQFLGSVVFPLGDVEGIPDLDGDLRYRDFLRNMILFLLEGSKPKPITDALNLLTTANISLLEKVLYSDSPEYLWTMKDQNIFELDIWTDENTFPIDVDPFTLQRNIKLVLDALKPAHTLYQERFLFKDFIGLNFNEELYINQDLYYYEDFRKNCNGVLNITGDSGQFYNFFYFRDPTRSFLSISSRSVLSVDLGNNAGIHEVEEVIRFLYPTDSVARKFTTIPTQLTGKVTILDGENLVSLDTALDFSLAVEGEILEILEGPNAGKYRLDTLLDGDSGIVGIASGPSHRVKVSPSILKLFRRVLPESNIGYTITVDRLGVKTPISVIRENVSPFFYL